MALNPPPYASSSSSSSLRLDVSQDVNLPGLVFSSASASAQAQRPMMYARIPKKREGWKADIVEVTEKQRTSPCYEVRREPLSRRIDFRDHEGVHNVMINHGLAGSRVMALEARDGQKLAWQVGAWSSCGNLDLVSQPSSYVLARFRGNVAQGILEISPVPVSDSPPGQTSRINIGKEEKVDVEDEEEDKARLGKAAKRVDVAIGIAALVGASFATPHGVAGLNARCGLSDEFVNLGRTLLTTTVSAQDHNQDESLRRKAEGLAARNRADWTKIDDPRPRPVPLDLVVASLVAVLCN